MPKLRIALAAIAPAAFVFLFAGCSATVKDKGKWGDLAEGGDVTKLHDAGAFCANWSPSNFSSGPACKNDNVCYEWATAAFPPAFVPDDHAAQCNPDDKGPASHCQLFGGLATPACNPGQAGDAYCQAYYAAWMQPGVHVHAECFAGGSCGPESDTPSCAYCLIDCGSSGIANDHFGYTANTCPGPDWLSMCVVEHDGSIGCQGLCADAPAGKPEPR